MAKPSLKSSFVCTNCGTVTSKWAGKCEACGEWNTIAEEGPLSSGPSKGLGGKRGRALELTDLSTEEAPPPRTEAGVGELDRVLGGGLVQASALLVGGDPGIGKSTRLQGSALRAQRAQGYLCHVKRPLHRCGCARSDWARRNRP